MSFIIICLQPMTINSTQFEHGDCSWQWKILHIDYINCKLIGSSHARQNYKNMQRKEMSSNPDDDGKHPNSSFPTWDSSTIDTSECPFNDQRKSIQLLAVFKPAHCQVALHHWQSFHERNYTESVVLKVLYSLNPQSCTTRGFVGDERHWFEPISNYTLISYVESRLNGSFSDLVLFPLPNMTKEQNYIQATVELESAMGRQSLNRISIPILTEDFNQAPSQDVTITTNTTFHTASHMGSLSLSSVMVLSKEEGLYAVSWNEFVTSYIVQLSYQSSTVCKSEAILFDAQVLFNQEILLATKYGLLSRDIYYSHYTLLSAECYTHIITSPIYYPATTVYALLISNTSRAHIFNANTKQTKLVDLEDKVIFAAVHPMMHTILLLTQSSSHIYSVLSYQTETDAEPIKLFTIDRKAALCPLTELLDEMYMVLQYDSANCTTAASSVTLSLTRIWYTSDYSDRFYLSGDYILFSDLSHRTLYLINQKLSSHITSLTHLYSTNIILLLTAHHQLFSLELDTTYLRIVDLDEVIVADKHSLDDDIPGYQHEPDKYTTLGSMTILSLFIDSLANVKLALCKQPGDSSVEKKLTWMNLSVKRLRSLLVDQRPHIKTGISGHIEHGAAVKTTISDCPIDRFAIVSSNIPRYSQSEVYKWKDDICLLTGDCVKAEMRSLWQRERTPSNPQTPGEKPLNATSLVERADRFAHNSSDSSFIYIDREDIITFLVSIKFSKQADYVSLAEESSLSVSVFHSDVIAIDTQEVQYLVYNVSLSHTHTSHDPSNYTLPGGDLVPVTATIRLHLHPHYQCQWQDTLRLHLVLGCPPKHHILVDSERMRERVISERGTRYMCNDPHIPCLYFFNGFRPYFRVWNQATDSVSPFTGNFTIELVGGGRTEDEIIMYSEKQREQLNTHLTRKTPSFERILTTKPNTPYEESADGLVIWNDDTPPLTWICHQQSPCSNVPPLTVFGAPEYIFIFKFSNVGVDDSTECNMTLLFRAKLFGIPYSSRSSLIMATCTMVMFVLGFTLLAMCWTRINKVIMETVDNSIEKAKDLRQDGDAIVKLAKAKDYEERFEMMNSLLRQDWSINSDSDESSVEHQLVGASHKIIPGSKVLVSQCCEQRFGRVTYVPAKEQGEHCDGYYINMDSPKPQKTEAEKY